MKRQYLPSANSRAPVNEKENFTLSAKRLLPYKKDQLQCNSIGTAAEVRYSINNHQINRLSVMIY